MMMPSPRDTNRIDTVEDETTTVKKPNVDVRGDGDLEFAWEMSKENVQPLRRGRDGRALNSALRATTTTQAAQATTTTTRREEAGAGETEKERLWRRAIEATESGSLDALKEWCALIKWTEQTYATGNGRDKELLPLLERCARELQEVEAYKEDPRYLRVWIKYADCCAEPGDIFKFLRANSIGQRQALYYEAYAAFLEVRQAYGKANEQYERGIEMRAEPLDRLRASYASFQHRMVRRTQKRIESGEIDEEQGEEIVRNFGDTLRGRASRGGGVSSSRRGVANVGGLEGSRRAPPKTPTNDANVPGQGGLEIYDDAENGAPTPRDAKASWNNLGGYKDVRKENTGQATIWAGQRALQNKRKVAVPTEEIAVFEDTECVNASDVKAAVAQGQGSLRQRMDSDRDLSRNPMLYHQSGAPEPPLAPGQRPSTLYRGFRQSQLRSADGEEMCYEENRAADWIRANGPMRRPTVSQGQILAKPMKAGEEDMEIDMDCDDGTSDLPQEATQPTVEHESAQRAAVKKSEQEFVSKRTYVAPPLPETSGSGSCASAASEARSVATRDTPKAKRPALVNKVSAGARWTADEEGTRSAVHDPTMTICTKEAWGDIMSMFSDSVAPSDGGYEADLSADERAKEAAANALANRNDNDGGLCIREDTCVLSEEMLAARLAESRKPLKLSEAPPDDGGLFIREDTVVIPSNLAGLSIREDTECIPNIAAMTVTPASTAPSKSTRRPFGVREPSPKVTSEVKRSALAPITAREESKFELINPFDEAAMDDHIATLQPALSSQPGVSVDSRSSVVNTLTEAAKSVSKGGKRAAAGVTVTLGGTSYTFKGRVGEGAHAEVYEAELESAARASNDDDVGGYAVKVQEARYAKWEYVIAQRLVERLPSEASAAVNWAQPSALHLIGGKDRDGEDASMGVLVMPFGEHGTLQDVLNSYLREGKQMHETLVMYYAVEMLRLVEWIHGAGIVHADLKPDNLLLRNGGDDWCDWAAHRPGSWMEKGLALIDFGRAIDLLMYPEEAAFVGDAGAESFRCIEMMHGKPWTYQADCYAIASTIHCLLYGSYMEVELTPGTTNTYRQRQPLRRYWKTELWEVVFDRLLNQPTESTPPPLGSLRSLLEEQMRGEGQNIRKLLMHQTITMFEQVRSGKA